MPDYYDGTKLLSLSDINGERPEIFLCTSNRNGGKTTYFNRLCVNKFLEKKGKFCLLYRYKYELEDVADKFFKDIHDLFFPGYTMFSQAKAKGIYHEIFLTPPSQEKGESCGYAISINSADQIKKISHFFSDVERMVFDEFQSETNTYCANETNKFISIHTSIARGQGKQVRYLPVYMISNPVTLINPYYVEMGISERLKQETKFLRGDGFVLEQGFNESASVAQKSSGFNRAFANNRYLAYASENIYLNDNLTFIEKPKGNSTYIATIRYNGCEFGIREFPARGIVYCDDKPDTTFKTKLSLTTNDHDINYVMLKRNEIFVHTLRYYFEHGCFRFKNLKSKEVILKMISY